MSAIIPQLLQYFQYVIIICFTNIDKLTIKNNTSLTDSSSVRVCLCFLIFLFIFLSIVNCHRNKFNV